jgi:predicted nucleic acid-binding protein
MSAACRGNTGPERDHFARCPPPSRVTKTFYAPAHLDIEVISAIRGIARRNAVLADAVPALIGQLPRLPIRREVVTEAAARRVWQLRDNMTAYDAAYAALAEHLGAALLTYDLKYTAAPGLSCALELLA